MPAKTQAFSGDLSLRYFAAQQEPAQHDSPSASEAARRTPQSVRKLTCRKTPAVPPSPSLRDPPAIVADDSFSMLMDTSLGQVSTAIARSPAKKTSAKAASPKKTKPTPLAASPLKNFSFTTHLRRISEVPVVEDDSRFLDELDTSQLERLAWETMELEQKAKRTSTRLSNSSAAASSSFSSDGIGASTTASSSSGSSVRVKESAPTTRPSRSRESKLTILQEISEDIENITPFVQLTRGRSRSPRKARPSLVMPEPKAFHDNTAAQYPEMQAAKEVKPASVARKRALEEHEAVSGARSKRERVGDAVTTSSNRVASKTTVQEPAHGSASTTKLPTKRGSRVSLVASQESREERRRRLGLASTRKKELTATSTSTMTAAASETTVLTSPLISAVEAVPESVPQPVSRRLPSPQPSPQKQASSTRRGSAAAARLSASPTKRARLPAVARPARDESEERQAARIEDAAPLAQPSEHEVDLLRQAEAPYLPSPPAPTPEGSRTTRHRSARLSLRDADLPPAAAVATATAATTAPAWVKAGAPVKKAARSSMTVPVMAAVKEEAAVQSAVAQVRKASTAASSTRAAKPVAASKFALASASSTAAAAGAAPVGQVRTTTLVAAPAATTATGRVLRYRKSLVAPLAGPTTVIGGKFRQTANGELVPITSLEAAAFRLSTDARGAQHAAIAQNRLEKQEAERKSKSTYKANPIPDWMRQRKLELEREEEDRLQAEIEEARQLELNKQKKKRVASSSLEKTISLTKKVKTVAVPFVSSVDARVAERQRWEDKRKRKEAIIEAEREKARREREEREEEEYREARKRSVIKANPLPEYLSYVVTGGAQQSSSKATSTGRTRRSAR